MKTATLLLSLAAAACFMTTTAHATLFYNETFDYPDGNLVGNDDWTAHTGGGNKPVQVADGAISISQSLGTGEDVNKPTGATIGEEETWFAAFDVSVTGTSGEVYFAHFLSGTSTFQSRVFITAPNDGENDFTFGLSPTQTLADGQTWADDFEFDTTHRIVVSYDFDTGENQLWVDPENESSPSISAAGTASTSLTSFAFRQASPTTSNEQVIDNLAVATTFEEALTGVPEPSGFVLGGIGLAGLGVISVVRARRKTS